MDLPGGPKKREVEMGLGDVSRIVLRSGVVAGESILLNPPEAALESDRGSGESSPIVGKGEAGK